MKRALVLSGGGSKGAYQIGVLQALIKTGKVEDYDSLYGVSVGALNASYLGLYSDFAQGVQDLENIWLKLETKDIYKKWFMWPFSILWKPSVYNSTPLENWVYDVLEGEPFMKPVSVGATSLKTGKYVSYNHEHRNFIEAVIASASFPGFFKPVKMPVSWKDEYHVDGGIRNVTPLKEAIEDGATHIDCITLKSENIDLSHKKITALNVLKRSMSIMLDEIIENDIERCKAVNEQIKYEQDFLYQDKRYVNLNVYRPLSSILNVNPLNFDSEISKFLINKGYDETMSRLNND